MPIETVAIIGKGAVGLLHGSKIAKAVGSKHLEYVMDDERYLRHRTDRIVINGEIQTFTTIPASQAKPVDLVILAVKATGLDQAINSMEGLVGPETRIISLLNGVTSEEAIAARYGWKHLVLAITQGMDAVFIDNALTFTHPGEIRLGAAPQTEAGVVEDIAELLERAGISHTVEEDIRRRMWTKTHDERGHQPNVHGIWRHVRDRPCGQRAKPLPHRRHARGQGRCQRRRNRPYRR